MSEERRTVYKIRCMEMRKDYAVELAQFYRDNPRLRPAKKGPKYVKPKQELPFGGRSSCTDSRSWPSNLILAKTTPTSNQQSGIILNHPNKSAQPIQPNLECLLKPMAKKQNQTVTQAMEDVNMEESLNSVEVQEHEGVVNDATTDEDLEWPEEQNQKADKKVATDFNPRMPQVEHEPMKNATDSKEHQCPHCKEAFPNKSSLTKHIEDVHANPMISWGVIQLK